MLFKLPEEFNNTIEKSSWCVDIKTFNVSLSLQQVPADAKSVSEI
jgi:hypothetical protein